MEFISSKRSKALLTTSLPSLLQAKNQKGKPANPIRTHTPKITVKDPKILPQLLDPVFPTVSTKNVYFAENVTLPKLFLAVLPSLRPCKQPELFI